MDDIDGRKWNQANVGEGGIWTTKMDDLEAMSWWFQTVLTQESLVLELTTPIPNLTYHPLTQGLELLDNVSMGENYLNESLDQVKKKQHHLRDDVSAYEMEEKKLEKAVLGSKIAMKAITWSILDLEKTVNCLDTEKSLLMNTSDELLHCSLQKTTRGDRVSDRLLKPIPPAYLGFEFSVQKAITKFCRTEVCRLIPLFWS